MNARLAARLTGWKIDIQSDTEFAQAESEIAFGGADGEGEDISGRCSAILSNGKRCPNGSLPGSKYCGVAAHQELALRDSDDEELVVTESEPELEALADQLPPDAESVGPLLPELEVTEVSLNFCALTDFVAPDRAVTVPRRLIRRALLAADGVFQLERLHSFSRKFHPHWRPRYLCVEKLTDLPLVGLAYLHVEQLLVPPGKWARRERVAHS